MQDLISQYLPSFESLGIWGYWLLGALVFLQGFAPTSAISPASAFVVLAGGLAAHGVYDLGDLIWFVAIGDILGEELGYRLGRRSRGLVEKRRWLFSPRGMERAGAFFDRYGAAGVLLGRFVPMGSFVAMIAGLVGMERRRFHLWNIAGGFAYALAGLLAGYFFGNLLAVAGANATRLGAFILALALLMGLIWVLVARALRALPLVISVLRSVAQAIGDNPDIRAVAARHPRLVGFFAARLSPDAFAGLPSTLLAAALAYFAALYASSALELLENGPLTQADSRIANLVFAFRDPALVRFFNVITTLGYWPVVLALALAASTLLLAAGRRWPAGAIWLVLLGNQASVELLKRLFHRPRPELSIYVEHGFSFPSGHAAVSVAFYGFASYLALRFLRRGVLALALAGASVVFLIGLSRVYLEAHYLSDVLNGWLVGTLWLLLGVWLVEWRAARPDAAPATPTRPRAHWLGGAGAGLCLVAAAVAFALVQPTRNAPPPRRTQVLETPLQKAFGTGLLTPWSETLMGEVQQPISLILLAPDRAAVRDAFVRAGWRGADVPSPSNLIHAAFAAWFNQPYPTAPITPSFWQGRPHDLGFQAGAGQGDSLRVRHHARIWDSGWRTAQGQRIFLGTASFDDGLKWGLTHHIDPDIDAERDFVAGTLANSGLEGAVRRLHLVAPVLGTNMTGDAFFTNGDAVLFDLGTPGTAPDGG